MDKQSRLIGFRHTARILAGRITRFDNDHDNDDDHDAKGIPDWAVSLIREMFLGRR
jgi:hypothetical protein